MGAGEACISPASYSLIADLFPKDRLGRALAVYSTGSFLGSGLAFLVGGWVVWRGGGGRGWRRYDGRGHPTINAPDRGRIL